MSSPSSPILVSDISPPSSPSSVDPFDLDELDNEVPASNDDSLLLWHQISAANANGPHWVELFADEQLDKDPEPEWLQLASVVTELQRDNETMRTRLARVARVIRHAHNYTSGLEMALAKIDAIMVLDHHVYADDRKEVESIIREARASPYNRSARNQTPQ